jgi:hypothetical protein
MPVLCECTVRHQRGGLHVRLHHLPQRLLQRRDEWHVRALRIAIGRHVRHRGRRVFRVCQRTRVQQRRPVHLRRHVVSQRMLQWQHVRALCLGVCCTVRNRWRGVLRVRFGPSLLDGCVHLRRLVVWWMLQWQYVRVADQRVERVVRRRRCRVRRVSGGPRLQRERPVRVRRDVVSEWLL